MQNEKFENGLEIIRRAELEVEADDDDFEIFL